MSRLLIAAVLFCTVLSGCSSNAAPAQAAKVVSVHDAWVKAADHGMTAAFAHLRNDSDQQVRILSATTPVAQRVELHEVVPDGSGTMKMRPKQGGFAIAANSDVELAPGADHLMLMDLTTKLTPGSDVEITVTFDDGSTLPITASVRDFPGADEHYDPGAHG
jgi:copper(I)-binding protein